MKDQKKNGPPLQRPSFKAPLSAETNRARRAGQASARGRAQRDTLVAARRQATQPMPDVTMTDATHAAHAAHTPSVPLSAMHGAPLAPPYGMNAPVPFAVPQASPAVLQPPLLPATRAPAARDIDPPAAHGVPASAALSPMPHGSPVAPPPAQPETPQQVLGQRVSEQGWEKFAARSATENRRDAVGLPAAVNRPSPELSNFLYDKGGPALDHQVKYGPGADIPAVEQNRINAHYGKEVKSRLSQYSSNRTHYVQAATEAGRSLTHQESAIQQGQEPGPTSINHVIASGTGQNLMNQMTLQFNDGRANVAAGLAQGLEAGRPDIRRGLAQQAAAVGRMTGIGRAILAEEAPQGPSARALGDNPLGAARGPRDAHLQQRDAMMGNVQAAFQADTAAARYDGYKTYLKNTFDSFGNLRLGHAKGNGRVSTGLDVPLTSGLAPTPRGERLYHANLNFGLQTMETPANVQAAGSRYRAGFFTTSGGKKISSSTEK